MDKKIKQRLLDTLAELGGKSTSDEDIVFEGTKLVIPASMTMKQALQFMQNRATYDEEVAEFSRTYRYRPWDGAYCAWQAMKSVFGVVGHPVQTVEGLFGPQEIRPQVITIKSGPGQEVEVPWGNFQVPGIEGYVTFDQTRDPEWGPLFAVTISTPRRNRHVANGLLETFASQMEQHSLYRGKAFDGRPMPEFLDTAAIDEGKVIYSQEVGIQLEANVWSLIRHSEVMRTQGLPLKRAVMVEGPYGTGKTLAAFLTAKVAEAHGWTFVYARPGRDDLGQVLQTARLYQPAVVFFEDMDTVASADEDSTDMSRMLDAFDGITAKGTELLAILTTNHPERIHKGMVRPGRLDAVIHIGALDHPGVEALIKAAIPTAMLDVDDFEQVAEAMDGFMPAFVKEAADRALRYAISRNQGSVEGITLRGEDFIHAALGLRPQLELMDQAEDNKPKDTLGLAVSRTVAETLRSTLDERVLLDD